MKIALITNSHTCGGKALKLLPQIEKRLKTCAIDFELFKTKYHGHTMEIVKNIALSEYDAIVSMGGDGTNYHVLNSVIKYHGDKGIPPLGIIPMGRGNSFAKDLQIFTPEDGISALSRQITREVDVCRFTQGVENHYFINLMGFGFVTDAARTASCFKWAGDASYIIGVLHRTIKLDFHEIMLEIDGSVISGKNCFVEFCNSRYTGGDMLMAPEAKIDDGFFDVVILSPLTRTSLISTFPKIYKGTHTDNPSARFVKGRHAKVITEPAKALLPDGEFFGTTPTEITILPKFVRYFA
jgi:YegS/Rv2252/BmrU family lipid kinase